jgi:hypothetical protein
MTRAPQSRVSQAPIVFTALAAMLLATPPVSLRAQSLRGSPASLDRQDAAARRNDYTFIRTPAQLRFFVKQGWLVRVPPSADLALHGVSYPYARPEVAVFLTRLSAQYHAACGRKLVVTSLTRPEDRQPDNASARSVHPTGMAIDIRYSTSRACRVWLERVLLQLEGSRIVEATRERYPPHFHVAVFPRRYASYVAMLETRRSDEATRIASLSYKVRTGDSLWTIAVKHGTTVDALRQLNDLDGSRIFPGQVIEVPLSH